MAATASANQIATLERQIMVTRTLALLCMLVSHTVASGVGFDSGSDGEDGALVISRNTEIDLSLAAVGPWDTTAHAGEGVYDPDLWVVVFQYTTIDITAGTVTFLNHPSGAPVVWLAQGNVFIGGTVNLDGEAGFSGGLPFQYSEPGPGAFHGGGRTSGNFSFSAGFGPGGGAPAGGEGSGNYAGGAGGPNPGQGYGTAPVQPFIGGSGASGDTLTGGATAVGGAGGGAILIGSSGVIELAGTIRARGGDGYDVPAGGGDGWAGSGGAIRLISNEILGAGTLEARGGADPGGGGQQGGNGRIRLEAVNPLDNFTGISNPSFTFSGPGPVFPADAPVLRAVMIGGFDVPADPDAGVHTVDVCVNQSSVMLVIEAENVPPGTSVTVYFRPAHGSASVLPTPPLAGTFEFSTTSLLLDLPDIQAEIQLKATW